MNNSDQKKLEELLKDKDFAKKVLLDETEENARTLLEEKGVVISIDEIREAREFVKKVQNGEISEEKLKKMQDGELDVEDMKQVSGGFIPVIIGGVAALVSVIGGCVGLSYAEDKWLAEAREMG